MEQEELNVEEHVIRIKRMGFKVFYGGVPHDGCTVVYWDSEQGDLDDFANVAAELGIKLMVVDPFTLTDEYISSFMINPEGLDKDTQKTVESINQSLNSFRAYVGKVGMISFAFHYNGVFYVYTVATRWALELSDLITKIRRITG